MSPSHRDCSTRLTVFGILAVMAGGFCILLGLLQLALPFVSRLLPGDTVSVETRSIVVGVIVYLALGGVLIWAGIGSMRRRRWVRSVMLTLAWTWIMGGVFLVLLTWIMGDELFDLPGPDGEPLPKETLRLIRLVSLGFQGVFGILIPALFVWAYQSRDVLLTCESSDPAPSWADRCPPTVLGLSLGLGAAGATAVPMAIYAVFPWFGRLATGWIGALLNLVLAAACLYLARAVYRTEPRGFWGTNALIVLLGTTTALTFRTVQPVDFLRAMHYPEEQLDMFRGLTQPMIVWTTIAVTLASLVYMALIKKHFK